MTRNDFIPWLDQAIETGKKVYVWRRLDDGDLDSGDLGDMAQAGPTAYWVCTPSNRIITVNGAQ